MTGRSVVLHTNSHWLKTCGLINPALTEDRLFYPYYCIRVAGFPFTRNEEGILFNSGAVPAAVIRFPQGGFTRNNHCSALPDGKVGKIQESQKTCLQREAFGVRAKIPGFTGFASANCKTV